MHDTIDVAIVLVDKEVECNGRSRLGSCIDELEVVHGVLVEAGEALICNYGMVPTSY